MKNFFDTEVGLAFIGYDKHDLEQEVLKKTYDKYIKKINSWSSDDGIQRYIIDEETMKLGDFLELVTKHFASSNKDCSHEHYIIFEDYTLVGTTLLTINDKHIKNNLISSENEPNQFKEDENPLLYIEYLATNPEHRNKGIGTRIIKGIINNEQLIASSTTSGIAATVDSTNTGSKRALLKNRFICLPAKVFSGIDEKFNVLYFGKHKKIFEKDL